MKISLKFVPKFRINNIPVVVQIMVRRRPGDKLLSEPMMFIDVYWCVIWPEWAAWLHLGFCLSQRFFFYTHAVTCKYVDITFLQHWKCYYFSAGEAEW